MLEQQLHDRFRDLLGSARAESCSVVATFLDIRGFSAFSAPGGPFDSALYLRSLYDKILSEHFDDTIFFKPTGDGLLLIHELPSTRDDVPEVISSILERAINLVSIFGQIVSDDFMINFDVPQKLGIGVARGSATRLISNGLVLDYTGGCLNLAARLMDKARPSGVVFSDVHASLLMTSEVGSLFSEDEIYVRGISEEIPISIMISSGVDIQSSDRQPMSDSNRWGHSVAIPVDEVRELSSYGFYLRRPPRADERVGVHVRYPVFDKNGRPKETISTLDIAGAFHQRPDGPIVMVDLTNIRSYIEDLPPTYSTRFLGITKTTEVTFIPFSATLDSEYQSS